MNTTTLNPLVGASQEILETMKSLPVEETRDIHIKCPHCSKKLSYSRYLDAFSANYLATCQACGEEYFYARDPEVEVSPNKGRVKGVKNGSWSQVFPNGLWHTTANPNWLDDVKKRSSLYVHCGSIAAALDRGLSNAKENNCDIYLYRIVVNDDAVMYPHLDLEDGIDELWFDNDCEKRDYYMENPSESTWYNYTAFPYMNIVEAPGSISMLLSVENIADAVVQKHFVAKRNDQYVIYDK